MQYEEIVERFASESGIEDAEEAARVLGVVIDVLGERIQRTERHHLAAQLPAEIRRRLETGDEETLFSLEELYHRIGARADLGHPASVNCARAGIAVLQEAVSPGEIEDVKGALGSEFAKLF